VPPRIQAKVRTNFLRKVETSSFFARHTIFGLNFEEAQALTTCQVRITINHILRGTTHKVQIAFVDEGRGKRGNSGTTKISKNNEKE
jgi:hypothetical protein